MHRPASAPQRPDLPRELEPADIAALAHDDTIVEVELTDASLADQHAKGLTLESLRLTGADLSGSRLDDLAAVDVEFHSCNLANVQARRQAWLG